MASLNRKQQQISNLPLMIAIIAPVVCQGTKRASPGDIAPTGAKFSRNNLTTGAPYSDICNTDLITPHDPRSSRDFHSNGCSPVNCFSEFP